MNFTHYDLGRLERGQRIEVTLRGSAANVRLMDQSNFSAFKRGRRHRFIGGLVKRSPWTATVPNSGHWHVTVDMNGLRGTVRSSVRKLPGPLPAARSSAAPSRREVVRDIGENLAEVIAGADRDFDVFVSHASPDKDSFVRPFAEALDALGVSVWFDEFVLKPGSSLRRSIDEGIRKARYGIVVLSPAFLGGRPWTEHELDGLVNGYVYNRQVLLPIWHGVDAEAVSAYSPSLADKVGIPTDDRTAADIAAEVAEFIEESRSASPVRA